ncbi:hemagglutinin repeat-containing protein, partial [Megasphaera elsdenii]
GKNVSLTASGAVRLQAGTNEETIRDSYQSHGASIGASFHGGLTSIDASYGKMKDQGTTTRVTHTGSHVTAQDSLMMSSGKDATLVGSQLQGQSVTVKTGGNLHIESVQDSETYRGNRSSTGISLEAKSGNASYSRGKTTSDYASVTEQAGIYAGDQGYDVDVNKDTQLKGAVIASTADANRNHLTTGTLHLEDIQNKAAYDVKNTGVAYNHYASDQERNQHFNETGLTPDILPGTTKDVHSVTRSAISQGTIQVTQGAMDVTKINRDTAHALQTLDHIFDKQKVEERQELARLFAKNADELLHYYDRDGKFDKALAHGLVAEITSQLAGNKAGSGFAAGMTNELLINKIKEWVGNDPAKAQWISAALGATVNAATGKNIQTGGATAQYGMKWNSYFDGNPENDEGIYQSYAEAVNYMETAVNVERIDGNQNYNIYNIDDLPEDTKKYIEDDVASLNDASYILQHSFSDELKAAGIMLDTALYGDGSSVTYQVPSMMSRIITNDISFQNKIHDFGDILDEGNNMYVYTSFRPASKGLIAAFGNLKMAVEIEKKDGILNVYGKIMDLYDFNHNIDAYKSVSNLLFYLPNEMAITAENYGFIKPYVYTIEINTQV